MTHRKRLEDLGFVVEFAHAWDSAGVLRRVATARREGTPADSPEYMAQRLEDLVEKVEMDYIAGNLRGEEPPTD